MVNKLHLTNNSAQMQPKIEQLDFNFLLKEL